MQQEKEAVSLMNLGVLAHVDAGKTTTVEQLLFQSGELRVLGSVDKGSTQTDQLAVERERGISVTAATAVLESGGVQINIIDTPGHVDFTGEVERALSVLDAAVVVVSAAEGIQPQTERFWQALTDLGIPTVFFVNKIDRTGCDPEAVLAALRKDFHPCIIPLNRAVEPGESTVTVEPAPMGEEALLALCEADDALTEQYLTGTAIPESALQDSLLRQTQARTAFPLLFGAASVGLGIEALLNCIRTFLPASPPHPEGEPAGIVYKIEHDKAMGKIAHIRLYEGTLRNRDAVTLHRPGQAPFQQKITQIRRVSGARREDMGVLRGNDIAAVYGMADARTGDMVGSLLESRAVRLATPLFSVQIIGDAGEEAKLLQAVSELSDEDPLLNYDWNREERELVIRIMGTIQLEILEYLLRERYNLQVTFSQPSVIYRETPTTTGIGLERYTMPKPCWAVVELQVDPLPRGTGYRYQSMIKDNVLHYCYQNHVEVTVPETLRQGLLGWEVTDLQVTLIGGGDHHIHTHPLDFFLATPIAVMKALQNAGTTLLEPISRLRLTAGEEFSGKLIGDILAMRGDFDSPVIRDGKVELEALVPVATSMDYAIRFASLTSGKGVIKSDFSGYRECPKELGAVAKRRGINPLDRDQWIL
ncbi:TetM/TetW/TetO/TetS family tetracycline resistance ribosomal protection protein, partial [Ruminococcaceae bacterium OttesenSCG-928-L11]|nr:TetM/TetW/TetO/TetS family tetracycline resistance ribosomal protection protein [Ruminococcaceae bacterium OttesenSCG-928-L11]